MKFAPFTFLTLGLVAFASALPNLNVKQTVGDRSDLGPLDAPGAKRWPAVEHVGKIKVCRKHDGKTLGFIAKTLTADGAYTFHPDPKKAATVSFRAPPDRKTFKHSLKDRTSTSPNATWFGAVIPRGFNLTTSMSGPGRKRAGAAAAQTDHITIVGVAQTAQNDPPQAVASTVSSTATSFFSFAAGNGTFANGADAESGVWGFDPSSGQYSSSWTNYDGSAVTAVPYYKPPASPANSDAEASAGSFDLVSDTQSYESNNPGASAVSMSFVPDK